MVKIRPCDPIALEIDESVLAFLLSDGDSVLEGMNPGKSGIGISFAV